MVELLDHCKDCPAVRLAAVYDLCERNIIRLVPMGLIRWAIEGANPEGKDYVMILTPPCANDTIGYGGNRVSVESISLHYAAKEEKQTVELGVLAGANIAWRLDPYAGLGNAYCNGRLLMLGENLRKVTAGVPRALLDYWQGRLIGQARPQTPLLEDDEWIDGQEVERWG